MRDEAYCIKAKKYLESKGYESIPPVEESNLMQACDFWVTKNGAFYRVQCAVVSLDGGVLSQSTNGYHLIFPAKLNSEDEKYHRIAISNGTPTNQLAKTMDKLNIDFIKLSRNYNTT